MGIFSTQDNYYRFHSLIYDPTRWAFLFGRKQLWEYLPALPEIPNILEIGCGTGFHLQALLNKYPEAKIKGIDPSENMLIGARRKFDTGRIELINDSYLSQSFPVNHFDLILCSYSLTMIPELDQALTSIKKQLKPGGTLLVVDFDRTPFDWFRRWMKINYVDFSGLLFEKLEEHFRIETFVTKKAYLGLWEYSLFAGKNAPVA